MRSSILAVAAFSIIAFAAPAFAQDAAPEETVSDDVDIALWCGAAYSVAALAAGEGTEAYTTSTDASNKAYAKARLALDADGIEEAEYERLISFYVDAAVEDMTNKDVELRYTDQDCSALIDG